MVIWVLRRDFTQRYALFCRVVLEADDEEDC